MRNERRIELADNIEQLLRQFYAELDKETTCDKSQSNEEVIE